MSSNRWPRPRAADVTREQTVLLGVWGLAVLGCVLGLAFGPNGDPNPGTAQQVLDLVRIVCTTALAVVLVLGPGLVFRAARPHRRLDLGFVPLPGVALLVLTACVAWVLASVISPRLVCACLVSPVLAWLAAGVLRAEGEEIVPSEERSALLIVGLALGVAIGRALWSLSPPGEWSAGTTFRTSEVGDRSDPRLGFGVVQLVAYGTSPFGHVARDYFAGYTFSARGPFPGLASSPIVLLSGGKPPKGLIGSPWSPFDADGFQSYRLAMMTFASTAFLSVWTLARRLAGVMTARLALLLAATTPFLVHEVWFTWPKLLAGSFVLLSATSLISGRPLVAGLLAGAGYLMHPMALLFVPPLCLIALWPIRATPASLAGADSMRLLGTRVPRPSLRPALWVIGGVGVWLIGWRLVNFSHYGQSDFLKYLTEAGGTRALKDAEIRALGGIPPPVTLSDWLSDRFVSLGNTLVPLRLFFFSAHEQAVNAPNPACFPFCTGGSPGIVHFFFQYWTGVPFGLAIIFFPLLLKSLWRAARAWPWVFIVSVVVPFVAFTIYWGDSDSGMLREGLHPWVLTLLVVLAVEQHRSQFGWLRNSWVRGLLALRSVEVLLVAMLPSLITRHRFYAPQFRLTDVVAVGSMIGFCAFLGVLVWRERNPSPVASTARRRRPPAYAPRAGVADAGGGDEPA